jgi:predicted DNA-binding transcriptional regulator AlpA
MGMKKTDKGCPSKVSDVDGLLTIREVSELTGLRTGSLYHFVSEGCIPVVPS